MVESVSDNEEGSAGDADGMEDADDDDNDDEGVCMKDNDGDAD